jgi:hypothetical protein
MNHIFDMPDLTEQAREDKIIKLDKLMIECGNGFEAWKENEFSFYSSVSSVAKQKMCELELWAKLNGHYEPKF